MTHRDHLNLPEPRLITFTLRILLHNSTAIRTWHLEFLGRLLDEHVADKGVCLDVPILDVARDESAAERCFELFRCGVAVLRPVGVVDLCDDHAFFSPVFVLVVLSHVAYQHFKRVAGHDPHHRARLSHPPRITPSSCLPGYAQHAVERTCVRPPGYFHNRSWAGVVIDVWQTWCNIQAGRQVILQSQTCM